MSAPASRMVEHPPHYTEGRRFETIEVLEDWFADNPWLWNAVKYLSRCGRKGDPIEDCEKALFHVKRYIGVLEARRG